MARTSRAVSPTAEGLAFYAKAQESLTLLDEAAETARDARTVPAGHLRITTSIDFGVEVMPEIVASFRAAYPQITVDMLNPTRAWTSPPTGSTSPCGSAARRRPATGRWSWRPWRSVSTPPPPTCCVGRPRATSPTWQDHDLNLARERFGTAGLPLADGQGRTESLVLSPAIRVSDFATAHRLTLAGAGIGHLPSLVAARAVKAGDIVRVLSPWATRGAHLRAVTLAGRELPARVAVFREHVRTALASGEGQQINSDPEG